MLAKNLRSLPEITNFVDGWLPPKKNFQIILSKFADQTMGVYDEIFLEPQIVLKYLFFMFSTYNPISRNFGSRKKPF